MLAVSGRGVLEPVGGKYPYVCLISIARPAPWHRRPAFPAHASAYLYSNAAWINPCWGRSGRLTWGMRPVFLFALAATLATAVHGQDRVLDRVATHAPALEVVSRKIWESPELGFHEDRSSLLLQEELRAAGFSVKSAMAGMPTAFVAEFGSGKPVIALLGEFDALPGLSQKDTSSRAPVQHGAAGHGCGHNLLGSASALAAIAIKEEMQAAGTKGTLRYYGTPAEEGGGGKIYMIHAGLFQDVDAVLTWHPGSVNEVNLGSNLAVDSALFRFYGTPAHAAIAPFRGRSALDGAMIMLNAVEMLREHVPQEARIHYVITNGGSAPNVVPAFAEVSLMARHPQMDTLAGIWERIVKCAQAGALASETRIELAQQSARANVVPNDTLASVMGRAMQKAGGYTYSPDERKFAEEIRKTLDPPVDFQEPAEIRADKSAPQGMASSDFGDVSWNVPSVEFTTATFPSGVSPHTWQAAACSGTSIGRKGMLVAARTLALGAMELYTQPALLQAARADFDKRRHGLGWKTLIPADAKAPVNGPAK